MNFLLKNLEASLPEKQILVGEKLLDNQQVASLYEGERNLWVAQVDGFEVEMQITPSRVRACSCECDQFLKEKMCGHIAAALMALRKHLSEKKAAHKKAQKTYQKLTINAILEQVGKEELSAFVRFYARSNRAFSNALKTRFAGLVPMSDNTEKYRQVIESVMSGARNKNERISAVGAKQLLATGNDLLGQANDALAMEHYVDSWAVLQVLVEKIVPIVNRTDFEHGALLEFIKKCFDTLESLLKHPIPPTLQNEIWLFLKTLAQRPIYRGYDVSGYFFQQLLHLADDQTKKAELLAMVGQELKFSHKLSERIINQLISVRLNILQQRGFSEQLAEYVEEILKVPERVIKTVAVAVENNDLELAKNIALNGLGINKNLLFQYRLKLRLLDIAIAEKKGKEIVRWATDCYLYDGQIKYLRLCKEWYENSWDAFVKNITDEIKKDGNPKKKEYLADIFSDEMDIEKLSVIIKEKNSLEFLMKYDANFLPDHQHDLYQLYVQLLDNYFSNHIGEKPTRKMLLVFNHLRQLDAHPLVDKLARFVRNNHPRRMELALELMAQ